MEGDSNSFNDVQIDELSEHILDSLLSGDLRIRQMGAMSLPRELSPDNMAVIEDQVRERQRDDFFDGLHEGIGARRAIKAIGDVALTKRRDFTTTKSAIEKLDRPEEGLSWRIARGLLQLKYKSAAFRDILEHRRAIRDYERQKIR